MQQAIALSENVEQILDSSPLTEVPSSLALVLPDGKRVQSGSF